MKREDFGDARQEQFISFGILLMCLLKEKAESVTKWEAPQLTFKKPCFLNFQYVYSTTIIVADTKSSAN